MIVGQAPELIRDELGTCPGGEYLASKGQPSHVRIHRTRLAGVYEEGI